MKKERSTATSAEQRFQDELVYCRKNILFAEEIAAFHSHTGKLFPRIRATGMCTN